MPKVHLVGCHYSMFTRTQFIILCGLNILFIVLMLDIVAHQNYKVITQKETIYKDRIATQGDIELYGNSVVEYDNGATALLKDVCPNGVTTIKKTNQIQCK